MQQFKVNSQPVLKTEWKQMDGQTDEGQSVAKKFCDGVKIVAK